MSQTHHRVDWVMETQLQRAFDELLDLIQDGIVTYEEAYSSLKYGYSPDIAEWFSEWWEGADMDE